MCNKLVCEEQADSRVKWCVNACQPVKYFGVSQMALKVMKVRCNGTSSCGGIKGSCMMKMTNKNQGPVSKDHESSR